MKSKISVILFTAACAVILSSCGGGGSSSGGAGLKKNEYLGSLPAMYADKALAEKADKEKMQKAREGDLNKFGEKAAEIKKEAKLRDTKFDADLQTEWTKIAGKDVPFTCNEKFKNGNCEVLSLKFGDKPGYIVASIVAKNDFKSDPYRMTNEIYYNAVAKDGSAIVEKYSFYLKKKASYTKGETLKASDGENAQSYLTISSNPEKWVGFAGIEFVNE